MMKRCSHFHVNQLRYLDVSDFAYRSLGRVGMTWGGGKQNKPLFNFSS